MPGYRSSGSVVLAAVACILLSAAIREPGQGGPTPPGRGEPTPYVLSYPAYFGHRINLPQDNPLTVEGIELGRRLFYDNRLSADNSISCGSCHQQAHGFADVRARSLGFDGVPTKRNAMSLTNLLWVRHLFWDGRASSLEEQAVTPMTDPHEMGQPLDSTVKKLRDAPGDVHGAASLVNIGYPALFAAAFGSDSICGNCHSGPKVFNETYHNNGLDSVPVDPGRSIFG